jgi:gingipain R
MNTGNFFTMHVKQLENYNQLPIVISVACNHGKYIGLDCMAEVFQNDTKNNQLTGSVAFTGSTILMAWAPPMETQDEFSRLMNPNEADYKSTIGAAFYNAQLSMLEHYPTTFGEEVMQTWLLFGDPSLKMRVNQKGAIQVEHPSFIRSEETNLSFPINENNCFVSLSQNNQVIATGVSANSRITFDNVLFNSNNPLELVATKPNYRTYIGNINILPNSENSFALFPVPTSKSLFIYGKYAIQNIAVYDVSGRIIVNFKDVSNNFINLETLSAGVYTLQIEANNTYYNYKIIKINE